jgi:hypothetical protein
MFHVLGLLFEYHKYHHNAKVKVYADDHLVADLTLSDDIKLKTVDFSDFPLWVKWPNSTRVIILPKKLFLFEINDEYLKKEIRIVVDNDNNNHTNGFMSDFSWIKFHSIFLMPGCMLEKKNWDMFIKSPTPHKGILPTVFPYRPFTEDVEIKSSQILDPFWELHTLGGSFEMLMKLHKKHRVIHLGKPKGRMYLWTDPAAYLWAFNRLNINT